MRAAVYAGREVAWLLLAALGLCLGCAGEIVPVGPGTYMVQRRTTWAQGFAAAAEAMKDANAFCARQSKTAIMQSEQTSSTATGYGGNAQIFFICASPGDPEYTQPVITPGK